MAPDLVPSVLAISAAQAGAEFSPRFQAALKAEKERKVRQQLLGALGSVKDPLLVRQQLPLVLDPAADTREVMWMMYGLSQEPEAREVVYSFVKENYDALAARVPEAMVGRPGAAWAARYCDAERRKDVADFFTERNARTASGPRVLAQVLEQVDLCVALKEAQGSSIDAFLNKGPVKLSTPQ